MEPMTRKEFVGAAVRIAESIYDLHERFSLSGMKSVSDKEVIWDLLDRVPLLVEEYGEHVAEVRRADLPRAADEACDVVYVTLGTLLTLGRDVLSFVEVVAAKNDSKTYETHEISSVTGKLMKKK